MTVLLESPWYQEILMEGEQRGLQQGLQQGIMSGIELGLERKFDSEGLQLLPQIAQIADLDVLKEVYAGLWTINTLEEIRQIYQVRET